MNEENLIRFDQMSKEEHLAKSSKGGINSAKTRQVYKRFKKAMMETLKETTQGKRGEIDGRAALCNALMREGIKGNVRAVEVILKLVGENPADKVEVTTKKSRTDARSLSDEELKKKVEEMQKKLLKSE